MYYATRQTFFERLDQRDQHRRRQCDPALFGIAREGVVLRYAAFGAVLPRTLSRTANAPYTKRGPRGQIAREVMRIFAQKRKYFIIEIFLSMMKSEFTFEFCKPPFSI